jgi:tetratricopeptide (TPR) repeat protein
MAEIEYLDFDLLLERAEAGYTARVLDSPSGRAVAGFRLPFSDLELENFVLRVGRTRRGVRRLESPEMQVAKAFGGRLFQAVFSGDVRGCLRSSLDEAGRQGAGLRVRIRLAEAPELADVPWEFLYNPALNRFLVLSVDTPLVRYVDLPERIRPLTVKPPLKVLVMISCPSDYPQLDVEQEWTRLREALGDLEQRGLVAIDRLEEATLLALQQRLRREEYHVFHFVGHGGFDQQAQDGVLLLEDEGGRGRPVSGQYLGTLLHDERTLRLVILNACEGARTSRTDPFAGTAQSVVQQGIPAVIAMQFEITDEAAITLAHEFYSALADGYPVDAALAEARKAIFAQDNDVEWGTPVLYMRAPDGRVFDIEPVSVKRGAQVAALYRQAQTAMAGGDWDTAIERLQAVLALEPAHAEAAARLSQARRQEELATLYGRGRKHYEAGRLPEALEYFRRVEEIGGDYKDVRALIAEIEGAKAPERATRKLRPILPFSGSQLWVRITMGLAALLVVCVGAYFVYTIITKDTTPPMVQVTCSPSEPTGTDAITFSAVASDDRGISRVQIVVDGEAVKECPGSPCVYEGGPYAGRDGLTVAAVAWDSSGNRGGSGERRLSLSALADTTPPTVEVACSPSEPTGADPITFRATASDEGGISRVQILVDGEPVKECAGSPCVYEGGPYADRDSITCAASAWDAAGNQGSSGDQHLALLPAEDTTPPTVAVTHSPSDPTSAEPIIFTATASDEGGISRVQILVDGEPVKECANSPCVYDGGPYADRDSITCAANAWDVAGNQGSSGDQQVSLSRPQDTTPPTVQVTHSPSEPTSAESIIFRATASDEGGISRVQILVDGEPVKECTGSPCVYEGGPYTDRSGVTCAASAWDAAGNRGESGDHHLSLSAPPDTTPPTVQVTYSPSDPTSADPVTFRATASDEGGLSRVQILVNAVLAKECPGSPCEYVGGPYAAGDVTYGANAYDRAGNRAWTGYSALSVGLLNSFSFDRLPDGTRITNGVVLRGDEFSAWGLRLSAAPAGTYCADAQAAIRVGGYGFTTPYLTTASPGDTARCNTVPVRIEFTTPVRAVTLRFAGAEKEYVLNAYGRSGQELGTVTKQGQLDRESDVTYRSAGANIARVEFGYQAAVTMVFQVTVER